VKSARAKKAAAALALLTLAAAAWSFAHAKSEEQVNRARFAVDGSAARPIEWRHWVHVGIDLAPALLARHLQSGQLPDLTTCQTDASARKGEVAAFVRLKNLVMTQPRPPTPIDQ
jgi:hypothetical protein